MIKLPMLAQKLIALITHDARKPDLLEWVQYNRGTHSWHLLYGTRSTGTLIA